MGSATPVDPGGPGAVNTTDLVLAAPYSPPDPLLLVLRGGAVVPAVQGVLAATLRGDQAGWVGQARAPIAAVSGTLGGWERADGASFSTTLRPPPLSGTLSATERMDVAVITAQQAGVATRTGRLAATEANDSAVLTTQWTMRWRGQWVAQEGADTGTLRGDALAYTGPGFLNATERSDLAVVAGRIVYPVAGTLSAAEAGDLAQWVARTGLRIDGTLLDGGGITDEVSGLWIAAPIGSVAVTHDALGEDRNVPLADRLVGQDALSGELHLTATLVSVGVVTDTVGVGLSAPSEEVLIGRDALGAVWVTALNDRVVGQDALSGSLQLVGALADANPIHDSLAVALDGVLLDANPLIDTLSGAVTQIGVLVDAAPVADTLGSQLALVAGAVSHAGFADVLSGEVAAPLLDSVGVVDALQGWIRATAELQDFAAVADGLSGTVQVYAPILGSVANSVDALSGTLRLIGVLGATAVAGDVLYAAQAQLITVVNAETGAVSTYTLTPAIRDVASYRGVLYLAGPDGLFALDAVQDAAGPVQWQWRTGFANLGSDRLKRVRDVNVQARTEGDTLVQAVTDRLGVKQQAQYRLPPLPRASYRDGVVKLGKGWSSVYWQLAATGIGPAEMDQVRLVVEPLSRRR